MTSYYVTLDYHEVIHYHRLFPQTSMIFPCLKINLGEFLFLFFVHDIDFDADLNRRSSLERQNTARKCSIDFYQRLSIQDERKNGISFQKERMLF